MDGSYIEVMRAAGRGKVRRRLEDMVNANILGVVGAQKVYRDVFGGELKAVKASKPGFLSRLRRITAKKGEIL